MLKNMLTRIDGAHRAFIEVIEEAGSVSREDATKVKDFYLKNRLAKLDSGIGRINVTHGAYLDADVIQRAVDMADGGAS